MLPGELAPKSLASALPASSRSFSSPEGFTGPLMTMRNPAGHKNPSVFRKLCDAVAHIAPQQCIYRGYSVSAEGVMTRAGPFSQDRWTAEGRNAHILP